LALEGAIKEEHAMTAALKYLSQKYLGFGEVTDQFFERQLCLAALRIRDRAHRFPHQEH
jgi:hypothetical protein